MKKILLLVIPLLLFIKCKKDINACKNYKEITGQATIIDLNTINIPEFIDTLMQHRQLQVYKFNDNDNEWKMYCHVFYNNLPVFSDDYYIYKSKISNQISSPDTIFTSGINISLNPFISSHDAITEAKRHMNFDHTCIYYRLGIYNVNFRNPHSPKDYKLVWKIEGENHYPFVIVDANTKYIIGLGTGFIID